MSATEIVRRKTRSIHVGSVAVGGDAPVSVQSMTNTDTRNREATLQQVLGLAEAGCEIIRIALPDEDAVEPFRYVVENSPIPVIADIHFSHKLAIHALESGAAAVRINPGNIGGEEKTRIVLDAARANGASVRIGVNAGSLEKDILKEKGVCAASLVESALRNIRICEDSGFYNFKVSLKASSVPMTIAAYRLFAEKSEAPLHIGVTEAGTVFSGTVKSAVGIGSLLADGIGDTLRVSLTGDPLEEVRVGWSILSALGIRRRGPEVISCPTCGRTEIALVQLAEAVEAALSRFTTPVTVAVMGCAVNGPGEAREADYGIAGGRGLGILFRKGQIVKKVAEDALLGELIDMLKADGVK